MVSAAGVVGLGAAWSVADGDDQWVERCAHLRAESATRRAHVVGVGPTVLVVGDSYAAGMGLAHPGDSWPSRLSGRVVVEAFSGAGFAPGASECPGAAYADRTRRALRSVDPDLILVEGGLNDVDQPTADIRAGVRGVLAAAGEVPVVLVGPPPAPARASLVPRVERILRQEAARGGAAYVPTEEVALDYLADDLHLTRTGHDTFGDAVALSLAELRR